MSSITATPSAALAAASSAANAAAATTATNPKSSLGQDDFLKLLVAQMTSQDPMNPMSNEDFIAQMAQFSTLQETQTMSGNLAQLRTDQQIIQANSMLGKTVVLQVDDTSIASGIVSAVQINANGTPQIIVGNVAYDLSQVMTITPTVQAGS